MQWGLLAPSGNARDKRRNDQASRCDDSDNARDIRWRALMFRHDNRVGPDRDRVCGRRQKIDGHGFQKMRRARRRVK